MIKRKMQVQTSNPNIVAVDKRTKEYQQQRKQQRKLWRGVWMCSVVMWAVVLAACGAPAATTPAATPAASPTPRQSTVAEIAPLEPLEGEQTQLPVRMEIPAIGMDVPVTEMGWQVTMVNGARTTSWVVPEDSLGWHANSAGAGAAGNTVISGRQVGDEAPLAALAVGDIQVGHEVLLTDADGLVFVYRITEISDPIPAAGATEADQELAAAYFAESETPQLTLATGWPEFTTTHRIFAVGELEGVAR